MKYLLSSDVWESVRQRIATGPSLLVFDFDGTLAPLGPDPAHVSMPSETRRLIQRVAQTYACAVISSRPREEVSRLLGGAAIWQIVGNDALEPDARRSRYENEVRQWAGRLGSYLGSVPGLLIENKGMSLALHYRAALDRVLARSAIWNALKDITGSRVTLGHDVINVAPADAPGKGVALKRVVERWPSSCVMYVGDDESDEEAFRAGPPDMISVRVGHAAKSSAKYFLESQDEVNDLMSALVDRPRLAVAS